jgi:hypothetical protein
MRNGDIKFKYPIRMIILIGSEDFDFGHTTIPTKPEHDGNTLS